MCARSKGRLKVLAVHAFDVTQAIELPAPRGLIGCSRAQAHFVRADRFTYKYRFISPARAFPVFTDVATVRFAMPEFWRHLATKYRDTIVKDALAFGSRPQGE